MSHDGAAASLTAELFQDRVEAVRRCLPDGVDGLLVLRGSHNQETMPDDMPTFSLQVYLLRQELLHIAILVMRDSVFVASRHCADGRTLHVLKKAKGTTLYQTESKESKDGSGANLAKNKKGFFRDPRLCQRQDHRCLSG